MAAKVVGVAMSATKLKKQRMAGFLDYASGHGWTVVHVNFEDADGGPRARPIDVMLHKVTDILTDHSDAGRNATAAIWRFAEAHPALPWIDPLPAVVVLTDRVHTLERLQSCLGTHPGLFAVPRSCVVPAGRAADSEARLTAELHALQRPLLVKARQACGAPQSHKLLVVTREEDLAGAVAGQSFDVLVQELLPHNGMVLKVYVINGEIWEISKERSDDPRAAMDAFAESVDHGRLEAVARAIGHATALTLFGFDVLYEPTNPTVPVVVDVNYFPGSRSGARFDGAARPWPAYDGIPDFYPHLLRLLASRLQEQAPI